MGRSKERPAHLTDIRVYYEDTDAGGVVYYANYLKFFERARTDLLRDAGHDIAELAARGTYFVVADVTLKYSAPARLGDNLRVTTRIEKLTHTTIIFEQTCSLGARALVSGTVRVACVDGGFKPQRIPENITDSLRK